MAVLAILSFLTGTVLGMRFRVMVLIPAITCALAIAVAIGVFRQHTVGSVALIAAATVTSLQIGYMAGIAIRHFLAAVRTPGRRDAPLARSQVLHRHAK
jgi:hypothetical protein